MSDFSIRVFRIDLVVSCLLLLPTASSVAASCLVPVTFGLLVIEASLFKILLSYLCVLRSRIKDLLQSGKSRAHQTRRLMSSLLKLFHTHIVWFRELPQPRQPTQDQETNKR